MISTTVDFLTKHPITVLLSLPNIQKVQSYIFLMPALAMDSKVI